MEFLLQTPTRIMRVRAITVLFTFALHFLLLFSRVSASASVTVNFNNIYAAGGAIGACVDPIGLVGSLTNIDYTLTLHAAGNTWASDIFVVVYNHPSKTGRQLGGYNGFKISAASNAIQYSMPTSWRNAGAGVYTASIAVAAFTTIASDAICIGNGYSSGTNTHLSARLVLTSLELQNKTGVPSLSPTSPSSMPVVDPSSEPSSAPTAAPSLSAAPTGSTGDAVNLISKSLVNGNWMEAGQTLLNDYEWVKIATSSDDFSNPVVFISVPSVGTDVTSSGLVVVPRVRHVVSTRGTVSFDVILYQANDSFCSKQWYTPRVLRDVSVSWMVVEKGAFNISGNYFMAGSGTLTRPSSSGSDALNAIRIDYPQGCVTFNVSCRFGNEVVVSALQQLQTLVNDRFLTVRAKVIGLSFARFVLVPHSSTNTNYQIISNAETLGYLAFNSVMKLSCMERVSFVGVRRSSTSTRTDVVLKLNAFAHPVSMFGMISTITANNEATSLRAFNYTRVSIGYVLQEDQCRTQAAFHTTQETVGMLVMGELDPVTSLTKCNVRFHSRWENAPSPSSQPSAPPTQSPRELQSIVLKNIFDPTTAAAAAASTLDSPPNTTYLLVTLYDTFGDGWENGTSFSYWAQANEATSNVINVTLNCTTPKRTGVLVPMSDILPDQVFHLQLTTSNEEVEPDYVWEMHWTAQIVTTGASSGANDVYREKYYGGFNTSMVFRYSKGSNTLEMIHSSNLWIYPASCFSTCKRSLAGSAILPAEHRLDMTVDTYAGTSSYDFSGDSSYTDVAWYIFDSADRTSIHAYGTSTCVSSVSNCNSCLGDGFYTFRSTGMEEWNRNFTSSWEFCGLTLADDFRFQLEFSIVSGVCVPVSYQSAESICLGTPPSRSPTSAPTMSPSLGTPLSKPFDLLTDAVTPLMDSLELDALNAAYFEAIWEDEFVLDTYDTDWAHFLYKVDLLDAQHRPTSITAREIGVKCTTCPFQETSKFFQNHECRNEELVQQLWDGLVNEGHAEVFCEEVTWRTEACVYGGVTTSRLCVGCADPCEKEEDSSGVTLPTATTQHWVSTGAHAAIVGFQVTLKEQLWPVWTQALGGDVSSTSVTVKVNASIIKGGGGVIHCEAVPLRELPLTSEFLVIGSEHFVVVLNGTVGDSLEVVIDGLAPRQSYRVFCASQALTSSPGSLAQSPASYMNNKAFDIVTPGQSEVVVNVAESVIVLGEPALVFSISVDELPNSDLMVVVTVMLASFNANNSDLCSSEYSVVNVSRSEIWTFNSTVEVHDQDVYMELDQTGCYKITLSLEGQDSSDFSFVLTSPLSMSTSTSTNTSTSGDTHATLDIHILGIGETDILPSPVISATTFNEDGSKVLISFGSPIDRVVNSSSGEVANLFPFVCSESFDFPLANRSRCVFTSANTIEATLPGAWEVAGGLPGVGANITVLPEQFKAACRRVTRCLDYPFVESATSALVMGELTVSPTGVITTSSMLSMFNDLHLDVSASRGDGGRGWSSVSWMVLDPSESRNETLENLMNDVTQLSWFDCIPGESKCDVIPRSTFGDGTFTFSLTLTNFFGKSSVVSAVVTMASESVGFPLVYIHGPSRRVITPNVMLDLICFVEVPEVDPEYSSPLAFSWSVLRDNEVTYAISNKRTIDPRRFGTDPYDLEAGHSYVIQVILSDDDSGDVAMAQTLVYVDYGEIVPVVSGGDSRRVAFGSDSQLELDATGTYDETTGTQEGLEFLWTCEQTEPLDAGGCDRFNSLPIAQRTGSVLSLNMTEVLTSASTFVFTLHISGPRGEHSSQSVEVSTGHAGESVPAVTVTSTSGGVLDQNGQSTLSGVVVSRSVSGVNITWTEGKQGSVLSREVSKKVGGTATVLTLSPMHYMAGPEYSFRLNAAEVGCVGSCVGYAEVTVMFNAPPRSGRFLVFPKSGEGMVTSFSLRASGWLDENYPLQYLFHRVTTTTTPERTFVLQKYSPDALCSTTLNAAKGLSNTTVLLRMSVQDSLGSVAVAENVARVFETTSLTTIDILQKIRTGIDRGIDFEDTGGLLLTLADITAAFESTTFDCSPDADDRYSDDCVELAELGIKLIKALVALGEPDPDFCNSIISNVISLLLEGIMPALNTTDLLTISEFLTDCIMSTDYHAFLNMIPSVDFFIYANSVIGTIKGIKDDVIKFKNITVDDYYVGLSSALHSTNEVVVSSYPVFVNVISVAQHAYDTLLLGESMTGYEGLSMLSLEVWKHSTSGDTISSAGDGSRRSLAVLDSTDLFPSSLNLDSSMSSLIMDMSSSLGMIRVVVREGYVCDHEELPCLAVTGEVYSQIFLSTSTNSAATVATISDTGNYIMDILSALNVTDIGRLFATTFEPLVSYEVCVGADADAGNLLNASVFNFNCSSEDTHGFEYKFENVSCLLANGNTTWELTCPLYNTVLSCASRGYGMWEVEYYAMEAPTAADLFYSCAIDISDKWQSVPIGSTVAPKKLPVLPNYEIFTFERVVTGVFGTPMVQGASVKEVPEPIVIFPTMLPTANSDTRSSGEEPKEYTSFPSGLTLLGIFSVSAFFLAIWISMAGKTPKIYSKKSLV